MQGFERDNRDGKVHRDWKGGLDVAEKRRSQVGPRYGRSLARVVREVRGKTKRDNTTEARLGINLEELIEKSGIAAICRKGVLSPKALGHYLEDIGGPDEKSQGQIVPMVEPEDHDIGALKKENEYLKQLVNELAQRNYVLKKRLSGLGWSTD